MARPWTWRQAVAESDLKSTTKHVLLTLSLFSSDLGKGVFPSLSALVRLTSLSQNAVRDHLLKAREAGWLDKCARHDAGGRQTSNVYVLKDPKATTGQADMAEGNDGPRLVNPQGGPSAGGGEGPSGGTLPANVRGEGPSAGGVTTLNRPVEQSTLLSDADAPDGRLIWFERSWSVSTKGSKKLARSRYLAAVPKLISPAAFHQAWTAFISAIDDQRFRPHMSTFLSREMWADELPQTLSGEPDVGSPEWLAAEEARIHAFG